MKKKDCRGLSCPQPVLATKELIEQYPEELVEILVDNEASKENVERFLKSQGWSVNIKEIEPGTFQITGAPGTCSIKHEAPEEDGSEGQKILVFVATDCFGQGDDQLGRALMINFFSTLRELGSDLWRIVFVNSGVKLTAEGSPVVDSLKDLEKAGVSILVCGTCLNFFELLDKKAVGQTTNMLDIITSMQIASKIIRI